MVVNTHTESDVLAIALAQGHGLQESKIVHSFAKNIFIELD